MTTTTAAPAVAPAGDGLTHQQILKVMTGLLAAPMLAESSIARASSFAEVAPSTFQA